MKTTKYVSERQFARIAKTAKNVINYPNPICKEVDGIHYNLVPKGTQAVVSKLDEEECNWYLRQKFNEDVIRIDVGGYGWFPTELVCGIIGRTFSSKTELAQKTGCLISYENGCCGSANMFFLSSKVGEAIKILKKNHFEIVDYR